MCDIENKDNVMRTKSKPQRLEPGKASTTGRQFLHTCFECGKKGHYSFEY